MPGVRIETAAVVSKPRSDRAAALVPELLAWLHARGIATRLDSETAAYAGGAKSFDRSDVAEGTQLLIVLGGDGTLLSAARALCGRDIPLFAVNLGNLGFLTSIKVDALYSELERVLGGDFRVERRHMLHCELWHDGKCTGRYDALNDLSLAKAEIARMIDLEVQIDGRFVCVYKADGLIVATPTGSTAYSLSAGGPIVLPDVAALAITPICPHMLTNRPLVVPDESVIQVNNRSDDGVTYLTIDGQVGELMNQGDYVVCKRSAYSISLVRAPEKMFFDVLREKLKWGGR
jgi:NAD+ kinase